MTVVNISCDIDNISWPQKVKYRNPLAVLQETFSAYFDYLTTYSIELNNKRN